MFRDKMPIPIPPGAFINKNDGRGFIYLNQSVPRAKSPRKVIGMNAGNGLMTPNTHHIKSIVLSSIADAYLSLLLFQICF